MKDADKMIPAFFDASKNYVITGEQVQIITFLSRYLGADGAKIRDVLRNVIYPETPSEGETVTVQVSLCGKSVCGQEQRPDSCLKCSELPNCVLDLFYEKVSKIQTAAPSKE